MDPRINNDKNISTGHYFDQDALVPARNWYVLLTLFLALTLNFMPLEGLALIIRPDFVAITIIYWSINQLHKMGMSLAFCMGLLMDVGSASILGEHALAYCIIVYLALIFRRRLCMFNLFQQAPQISLILFIMQITLVITAVSTGSGFPGWHYFLSSFTSGLLWVPISFLYNLPLESKPDPNAL
ncbi:MAG: rod shape-determining protein MreD [Pseudomonadota bacterium]